MHEQMNKTDMYSLYYQKTLEDLAKFEKSANSIDAFYQNFKKYLIKAIESEISIGDPDYSVEAGLESALDLLEWYYLKCQNSDVPFEYNSKIYRNTVQLKTLLDNFVETCTESEISVGVKARMEIVIKILDGLITELINPKEDVTSVYDRFDDDTEGTIKYPNIDDPDDLDDLDPYELFGDPNDHGDFENTDQTEDKETE